ncbi:hypothetical protein QAD02_023823 [Eretmocerus hayati]|uniref:Uncharacterized protein n=1 Tax=Eretmocerus hayati TaxID=131215 RepID=A0ACC2PX20_9HYME|nr:hypothetical protein QAD02_023823 [Eretmocerus hayati]
MIAVILISLLECFKCLGIVQVLEDGERSFTSSVTIVGSQLSKERKEMRLIEKNYDLQGRQFRLVAENDEGLTEFYNGGLQMKGITADIWNTLSEFLNFTLSITAVEVHGYTRTKVNGSWAGVMGLLERREFDITPTLEAYISATEVTELTQCYYRDRARLFIQPNYSYQTTWMLDLYTPNFWYLIITFYFLLCVLSAWMQFVSNLHWKNTGERAFVALDHFFYCFAALCNQGGELYRIRRNYKMLWLSMSIFSWLIITSFSSQLFIVMTRVDLVPPFDSLKSMFYETDYKLVTEEDTAPFIAFQEEYEPIMIKIRDAGRVQYFDDDMPMWEVLCSSDESIVAFHYEEHVKIDERDTCKFGPVGQRYFSICITAGLVKGFLYKKPINYGIIKLHEVGIIKVLKSRWLESRQSSIRQSRPYSPIALDQVYLPLAVYCFGLWASVLLLLTEILVSRDRLCQCS